MHSLERNTPCAACGDLDGCHLWQIEGVPVRWNKENVAKINKDVELCIYGSGTWHVYVKGVSRASGFCENKNSAKAVVVRVARLVMQILKLEEPQ